MSAINTFFRGPVKHIEIAGALSPNPDNRANYAPPTLDVTFYEGSLGGRRYLVEAEIEQFWVDPATRELRVIVVVTQEAIAKAYPR